LQSVNDQAVADRITLNPPTLTHQPKRLFPKRSKIQETLT
jgi:hypothetical protein